MLSIGKRSFYEIAAPRIFIYIYIFIQYNLDYVCILGHRKKKKLSLENCITQERKKIGRLMQAHLKIRQAYNRLRRLCQYTALCGEDCVMYFGER